MSYIGGSSAASIDSLKKLVTGAHNSIATAKAASPDPDLSHRLTVLQETLDGLATGIDGLDAIQQAEIAGLYSGAHASLVGALTRLTAITNVSIEAELSAKGEDRARKAGRLTQLVLASDLAASCDRMSAHLEQVEDIGEIISYASALLESVAVLPFPHVAIVAQFAGVLSLAADLAAMYMNAMPFLLDGPGGLVLQVAPATVPSNGGSGSMKANVRLVPPSGAHGTTVGLALGPLLDRLVGIRQFSKISGLAIGSALVKYGLAAQLSALIDILNDLGKNLQLPSTTNLTDFASVRFTSGVPSEYFSLDGSTGSPVSFTTAVLSGTGEVTVQLAATVAGTAEGCSASTFGSDPAAGTNGFLIKVGEPLGFTPPTAGITLKQGQDEEVSLSLLNTGTSEQAGLTYALINSAGEPSSIPPGMTFTVEEASSTVAANQTELVRVRVVTNTGVAPGDYPIALSVLRPTDSGTEVATTATVTVTVTELGTFTGTVVTTGSVSYTNTSGCIWTNRIGDIQMSLELSAIPENQASVQVIQATIDARNYETATGGGGCAPLFGTQQLHRQQTPISTDGLGINLSLASQIGNAPNTNLTFVGQISPDGREITGTLTWVRIDQQGELNWTLSTPITLR